MGGGGGGDEKQVIDLEWPNTHVTRIRSTAGEGVPCYSQLMN